MPLRPFLFAATALLATNGAAWAQPVVVSQPVVQPTGGGGMSPSQALNSALTRLARDPRNLTALLDAGAAALQLGDTDAAIGFFTRANEVAPGNGQVKAQIGTAMLRADKPLDAIRYFDDAERAGANLAEIAADRGLAYDLVGDNATAQRYYQFALGRGSNDELVRRYALSLAIAGDRRGAETAIAPLIQRQDRAAWRVRTFIMAITGSAEEAVSVAYASMPQDLAGGIAPYLRFMPRLTPAQQAAAANLGRFPRAADIGRDDPRIVEYAALHPRAPRADAALVPAGEPLGGRGTQVASRDKRRRPDRGQAQQVALATAKPAPAALSPAPSLASSAVPSLAARPPVPTMVAAPVVQPTPAPVPQPVPVPAQSPASTTLGSPAVTPSFDLARTSGPQAVPQPYPLARIDMPPPVTAAVPKPQPVGGMATIAPSPAPSVLTPHPVVQPRPQPQPQPAPTPVRTAATAPQTTDSNFAALFDGFRAPEAEQEARAPAVDLTTIRPGRPPAPKVAAKPAPTPVEGVESGARPAAKGASLVAKDGKAATARTDPRGERPDGPTAVSRVTEREVRVAELEPKAKGKTTGKADAKLDPKGDAKAAKDAKSGKDAKSAKDAKDAKSSKGKVATPSHPSRIWVQVLSGANRDVMGKEWRRLVKDAAVLKGRKPYISPWRGNFRLLTGPFESDAAAQDFVKALKKADVSSYQWTSPAGQPVDTLALD